MPLPADAANDLLLFVALAALAPVDMERPVLPVVAACDASPSYGFGLAVWACDASTATGLACQSTQLDRYLHLESVQTGFTYKEAYGRPVHLPASVDSFTPVLSLKAKRTEHSGAMEAHGVVLLAQWAARSADRHGARLVAAIDAQAVLGAVKKGRSSRPTFKRQVTRLAATCLAADIQLLCLWVPSAHNPADGPSRGQRRRSYAGRTAKVAKAFLKTSVGVAYRHAEAAKRFLQPRLAR